MDRDAEFTEVVVVLEALDDEQTQRAVERLRAAGLEVSKVDNDESIVEGAVESRKVHELKAVESVRYVRSVSTYTVDFPTGDPRDRE